MTQVRLHWATLPLPLGLLARHYWFAVREGERWDRWEVWQSPGAGGVSVGYLHCNLKPPEVGVGGGPVRLACEWQGVKAMRLKDILLNAEQRYPFCHRYRPFPGPNSNTFVAWVLRAAGIDYCLPWKAIGRNFRCPDV